MKTSHIKYETVGLMQKADSLVSQGASAHIIGL